MDMSYVETAKDAGFVAACATAYGLYAKYLHDSEKEGDSPANKLMRSLLVTEFQRRSAAAIRLALKLLITIPPQDREFIIDYVKTAKRAS